MCNSQPFADLSLSLFQFSFPYFWHNLKPCKLHFKLLSTDEWECRGCSQETDLYAWPVFSRIKVIIFVSKVPVTLTSRGSCSAIFSHTNSEAEKHTLVSSSSEETLSSSVVDGSTVPEPRWRKYTSISRRKILIIR